MEEDEKIYLGSGRRKQKDGRREGDNGAWQPTMTAMLRSSCAIHSRRGSSIELAGIQSSRFRLEATEAPPSTWKEVGRASRSRPRYGKPATEGESRAATAVESSTGELDSAQEMAEETCVKRWGNPSSSTEAEESQETARESSSAAAESSAAKQRNPG
jgi:hypothetical protein